MPRAAPNNGPKKGKAPIAHKLAAEFPEGTKMMDMLKKQWIIGPIIGRGGFGLIYLASGTTNKPVTDKSANYVIKIEPNSNGPLYCEMQFYIRVAQQAMIDNFVSSQGLKYLAVPHIVGSGVHTQNGLSYRFLVIPRLGRDLHKVLESYGGKFPENTVFALGLRMVDALEYLHQKEFVHADIKASNIILGYSEGCEVCDEVYLCDYGLAYRYTFNGEHKEYREDPRKAHEGTIEYTSRDAHKGVFPSRRGDFEILGYCMLQWLSGKLPWEDRLNDQSYVARQKFHYMDKIDDLIKDCLPGGKSVVSDTMLKYMKLVSQLDYDEEPVYSEFKAVLKCGLNKSGQKDEWKLNLSKAQKRKSTDISKPVINPKQNEMLASRNEVTKPKLKKSNPPTKTDNGDVGRNASNPPTKTDNGDVSRNASNPPTKTDNGDVSRKTSNPPTKTDNGDVSSEASVTPQISRTSRREGLRQRIVKPERYQISPETPSPKRKQKQGTKRSSPKRIPPKSMAYPMPPPSKTSPKAEVSQVPTWTFPSQALKSETPQIQIPPPTK